MNDEQQWPKFENRVLGPLLGVSLLLGYDLSKLIQI